MRIASKEATGGSRFSLALSGGSTPAALYTALTERSDAVSIVQERVLFFWSDERPVGPEHPESNFGLAYRRLLQPLGVSEQNWHRPHGEAADLDRAADDYSNEIQVHVSERDNGWPTLDMILLGLGTDGHTASLFPGTSFLSTGSQLVWAPDVPSLGAKRLTFSLPLINAAREIIIMVTGDEKADAVRATLFPGKTDPVPAASLDARLTTWLIDRPAARYIPVDDERVEPWQPT